MSVSLEICGMFILTAGQMGLASVDALEPFASDVKFEALDKNAQKLFRAITRNLELGRPPTEANILDVDGEITGNTLSAAKKAADSEQGRNKLEAAIAALNRNYVTKENEKYLTAALEANRKGDQATFAGMMSKVDLLDPSGGLQSKSYFEDFDDIPLLERPIKLSHQNLSHALRGGLGTGQLLGMSLWVAPTGMGKSTFWYGEIPNLCQQGHWVLYFAAESDATNIYAEVTRMHAGLTLDAIEALDRVPINRDKFHKARESLKGFMGKSFAVWSGVFDCMTVRHEAERTLREMKEAGATGKLIVIVDNYDALYELAPEGNKAAAMSINDEIHRLSRHVGQHDYHVVMLAQAAAEDEARKGPGSGQVYGNRKIGQKFGTVVVLYRPRNSEEDEFGPCIAIRKARQGRNINPVIPMQPDDAIGLWTELNKLPF